MKCPATDFIPELTKHYRDVWQAKWDECCSNKLHSVKPRLGYCSVTHLSRRDAVILRRLRIGHTRVTHKYLLSGDSQPLCNKCKCSLTVKHILLECCSLKDIGEKYNPNADPVGAPSINSIFIRFHGNTNIGGTY